MPRNVFLIGPMGVGKTTIGRYLAKLMNMQFKDADQEIEKRTGAAIPLIFEIEGEGGFRKRESLILDELTRGDNIILATGGGAILSKANRRLLRKRGLVVYLHASVDTQLQRTRKSRNRPLLQTNNRRARLEALMQVREPLYRQEADLIVNTDHRSPRNVAREIAQQLETL